MAPSRAVSVDLTSRKAYFRFIIVMCIDTRLYAMIYIHVYIYDYTCFDNSTVSRGAIFLDSETMASSYEEATKITLKDRGI